MRYVLPLIVALCLALAGCNTYSVDRSPDGTIHLAGTSLLSDKGIQRATVTGFGTLEGYSTSPNADAMKAVLDGAAAVTGAAVKAAVVAK